MNAITLDLTGSWRLRRAGTKQRPLPATVPGCVHTDLRASRRIPDPFWGSNELELEWIEKADWEYAKTFQVSGELLSRERVELVAEGLDTVAALTLNGALVASTENMFVEYRFDVKPLLVRGRNELRIVFSSPRAYIEARKKPDDFWEFNDPVGGASQIRKMQCSFGWDWGPRLPTSGIYRPIYLYGYDGERIEEVRVEQKHQDRRVQLICTPSLAQGEIQGKRFRCTLAWRGRPVAQAEGLSLTVEKPKLWWPNGLGEQPLYELTVELLEGDAVVDTWCRRIGLRTLLLDRHPDDAGESFQFVVNGIPVFAKGANWVPAHSLVSSLDRDDYDQLLSDAARAHMNMLRVWGGGIYEHPAFYDLCDEKGLLVWQDFMFACALYPGTPSFVESVRAEVACQVKRLRHHACLALFCGNNEIEVLLAKEIAKTPERREAYQAVFDRLIPALVAEHAPFIPYWPSSPRGAAEGWDQPRHWGTGDVHQWDVWHEGARATAYLEHQYRFVSEYGMQAYCSTETTRQFASAEEANVFGPIMETHQKHPAGNRKIIEYISHRYRFPKNQESLIYLSQINQAACIQLAAEHHRRSMPRTMGSLYWGLNDCWPVASWSSIEFGGRWRALHHAARRFFAPAAVSAQLIGSEQVGRINRQLNTVEGAEIYAVYDGPGRLQGKLSWTLFHLDGRALEHGTQTVTLEYGQSLLLKRLTFPKQFSRHGKASLVLALFLADATGVVARNTVFFTSPRFMDFPRERLSPAIKQLDPRRYRLTFLSKTFQYQVFCDFPGLRFHLSDNYFDLCPNIPHQVTLETERALASSSVRKRLEIMTLADSY